MKKSDFRKEEFFEFRLTQAAMNKIRGGDTPTPVYEPPVSPPPK
jgi:hypothetical protein